MKIHSNFDGGNIEVSITSDIALLNIKKDNSSDFSQWFHFRASNLSAREAYFCIANAGQTSYPKGWENFNVRVSEDNDNWFCCPTTYKDGNLHFSYTSKTGVAWFAYFAPYSMDRHQRLLVAAQQGGANLRCLGSSIDNAPMDVLTIGKGPKKIWVIARQHPGETMAEWWMEGFLARLLAQDDALGQSLLQKATFFLVPNMNPDGSFRGNHRTNAAGANLNREWQQPSMHRSPEVFVVREAMCETGVHLCLDVHGEENIPHNFIAGIEGIPSITPHLLDLQDRYEQRLMAVCPDFQREFGYPKDQPGQANLNVCSNYIAETFGCLALTIEQPFKDVPYASNPLTGWSPERAMSFGACNLDPIAAVIDDL